MADRPRNDNDPAFRVDTQFELPGLPDAADVTPAINIAPMGPRGIAVVVYGANRTWVAANIGFASSEDNGATWVPLCDAEGSRVVITGISLTLNRQYIAPAEAFALGAWPLMRLESVDTSDAFALVMQTNKAAVSVVMLG